MGDRSDFLRVCMSDLHETDSTAFMGTFCQRCRNQDCTHAQWSQDKFGSRVATQMDRLFNPNRADPRSSRYSMLVDFGSMLEQAIRLEVADRRGDWEVPDPLTIQNMAAQPKPVLLTPQMTVQETDDPVVEDELVLPDLETSPMEAPCVQAPVSTKKAPPPVPRATNTPMQGGGVLLGAASVPTTPPVDPWAGPEKVKPRVVPVGAKIQFGTPKKE